ncbi:MAG: isoleucine--tRNA ligase [Endomicrobiaceae bacterium]|nr:isoleucine--tRNA ligase [Endomicrobiaceae bacterium]
MENNEKKDYSKTVNLPKTDFAMKANLPQREPLFIKEWQDSKIYQQMRLKNKGKEKFILHDGPPYANGNLHLGHALNKVLKDLVVKYKNMQGFDTPFTPGWDCHGLPIETQCLKELKTDKNNVDKKIFRQQAGDFAKRFVNIQKEGFIRLGVFADWDKPYLTLDPKYEASIIKVFGELAEKGFLFRKKKPVYWCASCETALADAEVEYADHSSESIFVKFQIVEINDKLKGKDLSQYSVLIWTTTPWTLPSNVALAFSPNATYVACEFTIADKTEKLIVAKDLLENVKTKINADSYKITDEISGVNLEYIKCENPVVDRLSVGILADFVSMEDGTGVVHIAPGHGQEDYQAGIAYKLDVISPLNDRGQFTNQVPEFEGLNVFKANPLIIEKLQSESKILASLKIEHSYPHCWRCKKPVIFRATPQWFMSVEHNNLRQNLLSEIKNVGWIPKYGENRITSMIEARPDWCLSRQRLWGVPLPVFYCKECGEAIVDKKIIDKVAELFAVHGATVWFEKTAEELLEGFDVKCHSCGKKEFKKEEDILDVWFDSGVSAEAVLSSGNYDDLQFPADMYLEGSDQHRGWFQTSLLPSVALKNKAPYKTVLTHGFLVDGQGKKMSKSLKNGMEPELIINKYGADVLRLWVASCDYREDVRVSEEILKGHIDAYRKIRNTIKFLLGNIGDMTSGDIVEYNDLNEIDKYALSSLNDVIKQATLGFENYEFHKTVNAVNNFCTVFLSGFYLDALKDIMYCDKVNSKDRKSGQTAMLEIVTVLTQILAPILSFTTQESWNEIIKINKNLPKFVTLADYPKENMKYNLDNETLTKWENLVLIKQKVLAENEKLRQQKIIGSNLQASLTIKYGNKYEQSLKDQSLANVVFGSWDITFEKDINEDTLIVTSNKSNFEKCDRCWRHIDGIEDGLCARCTDAIK